jgi:hypothetical protein
VDFFPGRHETLLIDVGTNKGRLIVLVTHILHRVGEQIGPTGSDSGTVHGGPGVKEQTRGQS